MSEQTPSAETFPFQDPSLSVEERVKDLVSRLTLEEKVGQTLHQAPAIPRLDVPAYNWWNECLHGVARAGVATVFPQAIGLAAMWDAGLLNQIATAISDEARAKHHEFLRQGEHGYYKGLTFWTPNINIFRDPRWGRGHETYGECPYLTGRLGVSFCTGLQGDDETYLKLVATPKHYAVHSGPEGLRHEFDAVVSQKDLRETYLPAFRDCIKEAHAYSVMGAYNRTNGEPCCGSPTLLQKILRDEWGFDGYVVSDCWAIKDFHENHKVTKSTEESAAMAVKNGCDLNCGCTYTALVDAVKQGLLDEADLDLAVTRLFTARFKLGMFDPPEQVHYAQIPYEVNVCDAHRKLALEAARESIVLLKNDGALPLRKDLKSIAVIGPNAYEPKVLKGNYFGDSTQLITPLDGIRAAVSPGTQVLYTPGSQLTGSKRDHVHCHAQIGEAVSLAQRADAVVLCLGLSADLEGEQGDTSNKEAAGDKLSLDLPGLQQDLMEAVVATGKPTVLVLISGSALAVGWADENVPAVMQAWYGGDEAGTAIAEVLFGDYSPSGRLPVTFPRSLDQVPDFANYAMEGRTYRYMTEEPLYPFGYGLTYAQFDYSDLKLSSPEINQRCDLEATVTVRNTGRQSGDEVAQLYVAAEDAPFRTPRFDLRGFQRVRLDPGQSQEIKFVLRPRDLSVIDEEGRRMLMPLSFRIWVGGSQPDSRSKQLLGKEPLSTTVKISGEAVELEY